MDLDQVMQEMAYFLKAGEGQYVFDGRQGYQTLRLCDSLVARDSQNWLNRFPYLEPN